MPNCTNDRRDRLLGIAARLADRLDEIDRINESSGNGDPTGLTAASFRALHLANQILEDIRPAAAHMFGLAAECVHTDAPGADDFRFAHIGETAFPQLLEQAAGQDEQRAEDARTILRRLLLQSFRLLPNAFPVKSAPAYAQFLASLNYGEPRAMFLPKKLGRGERKGQPAEKQEFEYLATASVYYFAGLSGKTRNAGAIEDGKAKLRGLLYDDSESGADSFRKWFDRVSKRVLHRQPKLRGLAYEAGRTAAGHDGGGPEVRAFLSSLKDAIEAPSDQWRKRHRRAHGR